MNPIVKGAVVGGAAALLLGASLALSSATVVPGESRAHPDATPTPMKCKSKGASAYCLTVENTSTGNAILGVAAKGIGVAASGLTGVYGEGSASNTVGVYGTSSNSTGTGTYGLSNGGYGVWGNSASNAGVYGLSGSGYGVYGYSVGNIAGYFESDATPSSSFSPAGLYVQADDSSENLLQVENSKTGGFFFVDAGGDGGFSGFVQADGGFRTVQRARGGPRVEAFSPESTRATIEDTGTARLESGEGAVRFDSAFASAIDATRAYQVFLTPNGETRGWLYVAAKYEGGFIVREAEHGRSSVYFDYRVVAHPYGASDARLPQVTLKPPPIPHLPRHVQPPQPPQP
jgi:hypothetical protein